MKTYTNEYGTFLKLKRKVEGAINTIVTARAGRAFNFDNGKTFKAVELTFRSEHSNCRHHISVDLNAAIQLRDQLTKQIAMIG